MAEDKLPISVVILAKNEASVIGECLASLKPLAAREILVIDDDSTDNTASIAQFNGATVLHHTKKNFAEARNFGLRKAKNDWILYVDADEQVSPELVTQLRQAIVFPDSGGAFAILRINYYLGVRWPRIEYLERFFKKSSLIAWYGKVHESPKYQGSLKQLHGAVIHYTHRSLAEMVENTIIWSEIEAELRYQANHPPVTVWRIPRVMLPVFFNYYFIQGGWRVGGVGLIESIYQAFSIFITYARLWEKQQRNKVK